MAAVRHATGVARKGEALFDQSCDYLTDSDQPTGYLHCTPLDDLRYVPYMT